MNCIKPKMLLSILSSASPMVLLALLMMVPSSSEGSEQEQLSLEALQAENEKLQGELVQFDDCLDTRRILEEENVKLRHKVDQHSPALEQMKKDATERLVITRQDEMRWRKYAFITAASTIIICGRPLYDFVKQKLEKIWKKSEESRKDISQKKKKQ